MLFINIDEKATMARTLAQIKKQIAQLEKEAEQVRINEVAEVIERIKTAIGFYGLTVDDLFGSARKAAVGGGGNKATSKKQKKQPAPAKYRDPATGKTWTGHGKRPGWFVQAVEGGVKPEEMAL